MWIPYGTAERDCCHCQQDAALPLLTLGCERALRIRGLRGLGPASALRTVFVQEEEYNISLILRLSCIVLIPLLVSRASIQGARAEC